MTKIKILLGLVIALSLGLTLLSNVGSAWVTAASGACGISLTPKGAPAPTAEALHFCASLRSGDYLWTVVFYVGILIATLAVAAFVMLKRDPR
jgi:hypothetical protein